MTARGFEVMSARIRCLHEICIRSPGALTATCPNGPSGRAASERRAFADPVV